MKHYNTNAALAVLAASLTVAQSVQADQDCHTSNLNGLWYGTALGVANGNIGVSQCQFRIKDGKVLSAHSYCKSTVPGTNQAKRFLVKPGTASATKGCEVRIFYEAAQSNGEGIITGALNQSQDTFTGTVGARNSNVAGTVNFVKK
jgi:hypothetical protein